MNIEQPIEAVASKYSTVPLDYNSENDVQASLYQEVREHLQLDGRLETSQTKGFNIETDGSQPEYAQRYHRKLEETLKQSRLSRVRTELTIWHPLPNMVGDERPLDSDDRTEILDLAVLSDPFDRPVKLNRGRHRVSIEMVDTAVEIKYPRSQTAMPSRTQGSVTGLSDDQLRETANLERLGIKADLTELEALGSEYSITPYFVLCSQYDILRRGSDTKERHRLLADAALEKIQEMCSETAIIYAYPGGYEWLINP